MGYYAQGSGEIRLKKRIPEEVIESIGSFDEVDQYIRKDNGCDINYLSLVHYDDKYYEDEVCEDLEKIEQYAVEGSIDFRGEDDSVWRYRFDPEKGRFTIDYGMISYNWDEEPVARKYNGNKLEFLNSIIEVFETFLDEKGIIIDNPDKAQDDNASNIYGCDYGDLESELEHVLIGYGVLAEV